MRGLKSSCKDLANASGVRVRQGSGQPNIRLLLTGKVYLALGIPLQVACELAHWASGLVHTVNSVSECGLLIST